MEACAWQVVGLYYTDGTYTSLDSEKVAVPSAAAAVVQ